jgi:hypothetical protein
MQSNLVKREGVKRDFALSGTQSLKPISIQVTMVERDFALSGTAVILTSRLTRFDCRDKNSSD